MIHEHEQLEIASAGMDFPLAPDVERELERELADCPICAERAAAYRTQMHMLARLPVVNASEATRRRVTAAAMTGRADTRSPMLLLLAASLLLAGALAATAVVGALLNERAPTELGVVDPSISPAPASVGTVAATPPASASPTPAEPVGPIDVEAAPGEFLDVVTTNLRVRSEPRVADDSALLEPFLQPGDRVVVLEGPVMANDYAWLRIVPIASRSAGREADELPSGWVAVADHDGTPWLSTAEPDCPAGSVEIEALTGLHPFERLACFQNDHLAFLGLLEGDDETGWRAVERLDLQARLHAVTVAPEVDAPFALDDIPSGRAVMLSGGFDRPADFDCLDEPIDDEQLADLHCRSTFVLTSAVRAPYQFEVGAAAVTVTDNLRVRSVPAVADESARLNLLEQGTGAYVLGGPVVGSGYVWYEVAVPSIRTSAGPLGGWVAVGSKTGEEWLDHDPEPCPSSANLTFDQLADLVRPADAHRLLRCIDRGGLSAPVTVDARIRAECSGTPVAAPDWLQDPPFTLVLSSLEGGSREVRAFAAEAKFGLTCGAPATELHYHLEGHFADGAARDCRSGSPAPDVDPDLANRLAEFDCRTKFVVVSGFVSGPGPTLPPPTPTPPPAP